MGRSVFSVAILKYCKVPAELYRRVTTCSQSDAPDDRSIRVDVRLIESDRGEKAFQRGIAVSLQPFTVESAACFIDHIALNVCV